MTAIDLFKTMKEDQYVWLHYNNALFHLNHTVKYITMNNNLPLDHEVQEIKLTQYGLEIWLE
jgi:hypothetical protein